MIKPGDYMFWMNSPNDLVFTTDLCGNIINGSDCYWDTKKQKFGYMQKYTLLTDIFREENIIKINGMYVYKGYKG